MYQYHIKDIKAHDYKIDKNGVQKELVMDTVRTIKDITKLDIAG